MDYGEDDEDEEVVLKMIRWMKTRTRMGMRAMMVRMK